MATNVGVKLLLLLHGNALTRHMVIVPNDMPARGNSCLA